MTVINTPQGEVRLPPAPVEVLRVMRMYLRFGMIGYSEPMNGAKFGLVMQCGEHEVYGVKQQPVPCDEEQGYVCFQAHSVLIAHSIAGYMRSGFSGVFMPCAYIRPKDAGQVESGIAYFGAPSPRGRESQEFPEESAYDRVFGHGFTTMMVHFIQAVQESSRQTGLGLFQPIGLDVRPRLHMGKLGFGFLVVGPHVVCLKTRISEEDPTWTTLRSTGVTEVFHVPSVPAGIAESDLPLAKPPPQ